MCKHKAWVTSALIGPDHNWVCDSILWLLCLLVIIVNNISVVTTATRRAVMPQSYRLDSIATLVFVLFWFSLTNTENLRRGPCLQGLCLRGPLSRSQRPKTPRLLVLQLSKCISKYGQSTECATESTKKKSAVILHQWEKYNGSSIFSRTTTSSTRRLPSKNCVHFLG